jgi:hypothetical protein
LGILDIIFNRFNLLEPVMLALANLFRHPTVTQVVKRELDQARLHLLVAESNLESAQAQVAMYSAAIRRLEKHAQA